MDTRRNDAIQGLRGIAALLVVVDHSILNLIEHVGQGSAVSELAFALGELGVQAFFMISGFIMTVTMYDAFALPGEPGSFLVKRLMRILPLYWLATLIYVIRLIATGKPPHWDDLLLSLLFVPYNHGQPAGEPVFGLGWTLNFEMYFYCLFAVALLFQRRLGLVLLLVTFVTLVVIGGQPPVWHCCGPARWAVLNYTAPIILFFVGGVVLGVLRERTARAGRLAIDTNLAVGLSLAAVVAYALFCQFSGEPRGSVGGKIAQILVSVVCTGACAFAITSERSKGVFRSTYLLLGNASYSIYLTHSFITGPSARFWSTVVGAHTTPLAIAAFVGLLLVAASILGHYCFRYVERPMLDFLRGRVTHDRQAVA